MQPFWSASAAMDGAHVSDHRRCSLAAVFVGSDHFRFALAAAAVLSKSGRSAAKPRERSRAPVRQHLALARCCCFPAIRLGVVVALVTGICIGWFPHARYWGMPLLKVVGPIPATAWVPLAMVLSPSGAVLGGGTDRAGRLVSGHDADRLRHCQHARFLSRRRPHTRAPGRRYLIFRVAIPAAMPNIFIGLFMGLGASFLTLIVAETVGVKSGLGWYVSWAQGWAEYGKVYAALVIMAAFFSTIMTVLFKVRDRVLVWQKGSHQVVTGPRTAAHRRLLAPRRGSEQTFPGAGRFRRAHACAG